jgi:hypothetical protein
VTLVSDIITDAYRETNQIALGKSPSANQLAEGLRRLQALINSLMGTDAGEFLVDWPLGDYGRQSLDTRNLTVLEIGNPPINSRLVHTAFAPITIYFPPAPSDGARMCFIDPFGRAAAVNVTLDGNGRLIEAAATKVLSVAGQSSTWFFRADLGTWVKVTDLLTTDTMPFPAMFDDFFSIYLAMRVSPRYGRELNAASALVLKNSRRNFVARYLQSQDLAMNSDLAHDSRQSFDYSRGCDPSTDQFNRGR